MALQAGWSPAHCPASSTPCCERWAPQAPGNSMLLLMLCPAPCGDPLMKSQLSGHCPAGGMVGAPGYTEREACQCGWVEEPTKKEPLAAQDPELPLRRAGGAVTAAMVLEEDGSIPAPPSGSWEAGAL